MVKPVAGYRPLAYSSPEAVQTTGTVAIGGAIGAQALGERCMRSRSLRCLSAALAACALLSAAAQAQVIPFSGHFGRGLAPSDSEMVCESVARLNAVEPS